MTLYLFEETEMNAYQQSMYDNLMALVENSETFYFQDFVLEDKNYRIFNYRLSSYTEFMKPSALECRGHMFEVNGDVAVRLAALPMQKFFNLHENPMTMDLDLSMVDSVELKADGSLISTYAHFDANEGCDVVRLKSKGSLSSEQATKAMDWFGHDDVREFRSAVQYLVGLGYTVNMEWCAPDNRIVIGYEHAHLKVLNVRSMNDGSYMDRSTMEIYFRPEYLIDRVNTNGLDTAAFVQSIPAMLDDIEGYVARIGDLWFKIKTNKYMSLHHTKDSINNPRRLYEAVLDEGVDDLRALFFEDKLAIKLIDEMQEKVDKLYNHLVVSVEGFYNANKHLDRKAFAIKGQAEVPRLHFGLVMNLYVGKPANFKEFMKSKYKEFGFRDEQVEEV